MENILKRRRRRLGKSTESVQNIRHQSEPAKRVLILTRVALVEKQKHVNNIQDALLFDEGPLQIVSLAD